LRQDCAVRSGDVAQLPRHRRVEMEGVWWCMVVIREVVWPIVVVLAVWYCVILHCLYINVSTVKRKEKKKHTWLETCMRLIEAPSFVIDSSSLWRKGFGARDVYAPSLVVVTVAVGCYVGGGRVTIRLHIIKYMRICRLTIWRKSHSRHLCNFYAYPAAL
jgi:hypothetical protein